MARKIDPAQRYFMEGVMAGAPPRKKGDFYPTPWIGTEAFMRAEAKAIAAHARVVHECACGDGAMARVMEAHGFRVIGTDLYSRGYGQSGVDFLKLKQRAAACMISNPPYKRDLPERFVRHAAVLGYGYIAMLLKANYFNADKRRALFRELPPARIYPLSFRLDFLNKKRPTMDCIWVVWDRRARGPCVFMPGLEKPEA